MATILTARRINHKSVWYQPNLKLSNNLLCALGSGGHDLLLPDPWLGGAYRHGGEQTPQAPPTCVL